jgi:hypothetical protein
MSQERLAQIAERRTTLNMELRQVNSRREKIVAEINTLLAEQKKLKKAAKILKDGGVSVSDHALLRWLERIHGIDIERLRTAVLTENQLKAFAAGASAVQSQGHRFIVKNKTLITIAPMGSRP